MTDGVSGLMRKQGRPTQAQAAQNATSTTAAGEDKLQKVTAALDRERELDGKTIAHA